MLKYTEVVWHCAVMVLFIGIVWSQTTSIPSSTTTTAPATTTTAPATTTTTAPATTTTTAPATTPSDIQECQAVNASCDKCVSVAKCMWCNSKPEKCFPYPVGQVIPHKDVCPLTHARWGVCWVNYKILLICMGVLAILLLLFCTCCIYCCCCRSKGNSQKYQKEDAKIERERSERKSRHEERRAERKEKLDDIRRKYGLVKDDNRYERFDA